jgi:hypothetical protein
MRMIASHSSKVVEDSTLSSAILRPSPSSAKKSGNNAAEQAPMCQFCDDAPTTSVCQDCATIKNLCDDCHLVRHRKESMQGHTRVPWSAKITNPMCAEHNHECLMYCSDDHSAICALCTFGTHKGHTVVVTSEESAAAKTRLRAAVAELESLTQEVQSAGLKISGRFEEITGRSPMDTSKVGTVSHAGGTSYAAVLSINRHLDNLIDLIERRRRVLIDQVYAISAEKSAALTEQMDTNSVYVARNYSVCFNARQCMEQESDVYLLGHESELLSGISRQVQWRKNISIIPATSRYIHYTVPTDSGIEDMIRDLGSVAAVEVDAKRCEFANSEILRSLVVDDEISLSLQVMDRAGQPVSAGGEDVSCDIRSVSTGAATEHVASVVDRGDGSYNIMVRIGAAGEYAMGVSVGGVEMTGSPFTISVSEKKKKVREKVSGRKEKKREGGGAEPFLKPQGICCYNGLLYVCDVHDNCVKVYHCSDGAYVRSIGSEGRGDGQFVKPMGICCEKGLLYICDSDNHRVQVIRLDGSFVRIIGKGEGDGLGQLCRPRGVCCNNGFVSVCDAGNNRVQVFRDDGCVARTIGSEGTGPGQFKCPSRICYLNGHLYITDSGNNRVQVFFINGSYMKSIGREGNGAGQFRGPFGIFGGKEIVVTDGGNSRVQVFHKDGSFSKIFGESRRGSANHQFSFPVDVCCDRQFMYVCDKSKNCVQVFRHKDESFVRFIGAAASGAALQIESHPPPNTDAKRKSAVVMETAIEKGIQNLQIEVDNILLAIRDDMEPTSINPFSDALERKYRTERGIMSKAIENAVKKLELEASCSLNVGEFIYYALDRLDSAYMDMHEMVAMKHRAVSMTCVTELAQECADIVHREAMSYLEAQAASQKGICSEDTLRQRVAILVKNLNSRVKQMILPWGYTDLQDAFDAELAISDVIDMILEEWTFRTGY